ncbi:MAG: hypothetical protein KAI02_00370 [Gammaproteobacteria bacterium]|nr:hypothetical protein [Gammaproteobacteria bacterium]
MYHSLWKKYFFFVLLIIFSNIIQAENLKPFVLANSVNTDMLQTVTQIKNKLLSNGFEVIGEYSPYKEATIIIVTNNDLKKNALKTEYGAYGAIQRIAVTDVAGVIQVTYTNPVYMATAYRMKGNMEQVAAHLKNALGEKKTYGSKKGLSPKKLANYHYMFSMPYFDDPDLLADHGNYDQAVQKVKAGLLAQKGGISKVYQLEISGKKQMVIGVAMTEGMSNDKTIMKEIDFQDIRASAHLPYEILIHENGKVYALNAKFRIAINFPDLAMTGDHSFMGIMDSPDAIKKALSLVAGKQVRKTSNSGGFGF